MAKESRFKFDAPEVAEKAIDDAANGVLQAEIEAAEAAELAEAAAATESEPETVTEADVAAAADDFAELLALQTKITELEAALAAKASPKVTNKSLVRQLRARDPKNKKTCAVCHTRVPLADIGYGNNEVCDSCEGK